MEDAALSKIQGWFEHLDRKVEEFRNETRLEFGAVRQEMVTKQQFENRFHLLLTAMMNLNERVETYKDRTDTEIQIIKRALHDLDEEVKQIRDKLH